MTDCNRRSSTRRLIAVLGLLVALAASPFPRRRGMIVAQIALSLGLLMIGGPTTISKILPEHRGQSPEPQLC